MTFRNRPLGSLRVYGGPFNEEDERLLRAFAASAATAVATAQNAGEEALRRCSRPPRRSARAGRASCTTRRCSSSPGCGCCWRARAAAGDRERIDAALEAALEQLTTGIGDLRSLIADLRPAALGRAGHRAGAGDARGPDVASVEVDLDVTLAARPSAEIESTIYRVVQEALTNVAKHAARDARRGAACTTATASIEVLVRDDGAGFDPHRRSTGFGLVGMRERLALVRGTLEIGRRRAAGPRCAPRSRIR